MINNGEEMEVADEEKCAQQIERKRRKSGIPNNSTCFPRTKNNFSSGTLPSRKNESIPVNTLRTNHSSKIMVKSYRVDTSGKSRGRNSDVITSDQESCVSPDRNQSSEVDAKISAEDVPINETEEPSSADKYAYPMNRTYIQESLFNHRGNSKTDNFSRRFSLPSTHILYEKNKHRGGANVAELEKVTEMLRAMAVVEDSYNKPEEIMPTELTLTIRIMGPMNDGTFGYVVMNMDNMKEFYENKLRKLNIVNVVWTKTGTLPRASYEQQAYVMEAEVTLEETCKYPHQQLIEFIVDFSKQLRGMIHDQPSFDIVKHISFFPIVFPTHSDITVVDICVGNCLNTGLFLIRGDYITEKNAISNLKLYTERDSSAFKVAGKNECLSFARFEHDKRQLLVYFGVRTAEFTENGLEYAGFRLNLYYNSFVRIIVDMSRDEGDTIYIQLKNPPQLWEAVPKSPSFQSTKTKVLNMETCQDWIRVLTWPADADLRGRGCSPEVYAQSGWIRLRIKKMGDDTFSHIITRIQSRCSAKISFGPILAIRRKLAPSPALCSLGSFRANYALQALITRGSVVLDQLYDCTTEGIPFDSTEPIDLEHEPLFLKYVRKSMAECPRACEETLEQILNAIDEKRVIDILDAFRLLYSARKDQYERLLAGERIQDTGLAKPLPKNCVSVAKVVVSPARVLLMAPEVMMVNRVVRKFGPEYALRCVFRDESGGRLVIRDFSIMNIDHITNFVTQSIYNTLSSGIPIADRVYSFLGWSNSQMRDQGCYMYAPKVDPKTGVSTGSVDEIRRWMGDFRGAITVPKMMSRMGQCFTQAQPTVKLHQNDWIVDADIMGGPNNQFCFSDGCGKICMRLAQKIARILHLKEVPACFQVRFKGFKGIVVLDPMMDQIVGSPKIIFRKSQQKFLAGTSESEVDYLEVVKYAMPSPVCLNRPFITILDQVSEKQSTESHQRILARVHYYLERELSLLSNMLVNERCAAEELMNRTNLPIDWLSVTSNSGYCLTTDPFVRNMIVSVYRYNIIHHISKAKIFLPGNMGRSMYGVVDETGALQHGQVFIQYSPSLRQTSSRPILLTGKVLITKNPCHVPGDVRVFEAIYQPSLTHLVDVVVFPQHGPRPHPDEMAGSDLDGDEYSVIWDQEMLLNYNEKAMVFPSSQAAKAEKEPTTDDMVAFFLKYLQQDSIGRMSNAHLAYADLHGLFHENCHSIALKCSVAVDFPKSGIPADPLTSFEQCEVSPDYMMSGGKPMYYSTRLNGQLYRKAKKVEEILEECEKRGSIFECDYDKVLCPDDIDVFYGNEKKLFEAERIRDEYARRMQQLLDEYGIEDEASIVSGHAAIIKRLAGMEKDDYSFYHTDKVVELRYEKMYSSFRAKFFEEFNGEQEHFQIINNKPVIDCTPAMHEKIRQWYYVAYVMPRKNKSGSIVGQSLPWVVWEAVVHLRRKLMIEQNIPIQRLKYPISNRFSQEIRESIGGKQLLLDDFKKRIEKEQRAYCVKRYSAVYGYQLIEVLFIINEWLRRENVLTNSLNIWNVGRLLIQFACGKTQGSLPVDYERTIMKTDPIFSDVLCMNGNEETSIQEIDIGCLLIEFIRYMGCQSFASANHMNLRVFNDRDIVEPVLLKCSDWLPLHHVSYRTFHSIAVSGLFDSLHLGGHEEDSRISECKDPILVNDSIFVTKNYEDIPVSRCQVLSSLKQWSGVKEILTREYTGRKSDLVYVTSVGTVLSRQKLARLLLLSGEAIREAIICDRIPNEVRDDFM